MRLISAVAVSSCAIHATEMEGGQGESMVTSHLLQGTYSRWCDGPEEYQGYSGSNPGKASCSRDDSRWCSVTSIPGRVD